MQPLPSPRPGFCANPLEGAPMGRLMQQPQSCVSRHPLRLGTWNQEHLAVCATLVATETALRATPSQLTLARSMPSASTSSGRHNLKPLEAVAPSHDHHGRSPSPSSPRQTSPLPRIGARPCLAGTGSGSGLAGSGATYYPSLGRTPHTDEHSSGG
jgi:hypothetical protein